MVEYVWQKGAGATGVRHEGWSGKVVWQEGAGETEVRQEDSGGRVVW